MFAHLSSHRHVSRERATCAARVGDRLQRHRTSPRTRRGDGASTEFTGRITGSGDAQIRPAHGARNLLHETSVSSARRYLVDVSGDAHATLSGLARREHG